MAVIQDKYEIDVMITDNKDETRIVGLVLKNNADNEKLEIDLVAETVEILEED
jgi:hypothetical protein